jgi:hypothetical protein
MPLPLNPIDRHISQPVDRHHCSTLPPIAQFIHCCLSFSASAIFANYGLHPFFGNTKKPQQSLGSVTYCQHLTTPASVACIDASVWGCAVAGGQISRVSDKLTLSHAWAAYESANESA